MGLTCPVCSAESVLERQTVEADLWRCPSCDHCFSDIDSIGPLEDYSSRYFEETHGAWFRNPNVALFDAISTFIVQNKPGASLIDLGCGNGDFLRHLRRKQIEVSLTGIDIVENQPAEGITFLTGDALSMNFGRQYDVIVSLAVIEHVADVQMFMKRLHSLCAPSGYVIIMTVNERSILFEAAKMLHKLGVTSPCDRLYSKHHLNHFNSSSLRRLIEVNDFEINKIMPHNAPIAAIDFMSYSKITTAFLRAGVMATFLLGSLTGRSYQQTIICQKKPK